MLGTGGGLFNRIVCAMLLAATAGILLAVMLFNLRCSRHKHQLLSHVFTHTVHLALATAAYLIGFININIMNNNFTCNVLSKELSIAFTLLFLLLWCVFTISLYLFKLSDLFYFIEQVTLPRGSFVLTGKELVIG